MKKIIALLLLSACEQPTEETPPEPEHCPQLLECQTIDDVDGVSVFLDGQCITCANTANGTAWIRIARASCQGLQ